MKFRTEYEAVQADFSLNPDIPVVLLGSCFSQNIARKMSEHLWEAVLPAGTLYNPVSISRAIGMLTNIQTGEYEFRESLFQYNGVWNSHMFDSSFSAIEKDICIEKFKNRQIDFNRAIEKGAPLVLTFGTAICYHLHETSRIVGNCHKLPADLFYRQRLTIGQVTDTVRKSVVSLRQSFPQIKIILTVSPVRHLKDGFAGNSRSKAVLLLGMEEICSQLENVVYFPAFEILNDDLRDYRFYASDLCHPSEPGIDYVWEKFCDTFLSPSSRADLRENLRRYKSTLHRPLL